MAETKRAYRMRQTNAASGTTLTQRIRVESPVRRVFISQVGVSDSVTANAVARIAIETGAAQYPIVSQLCAVAGRFYNADLNIWLYEGEALRVDWSSINASDVLSVVAVGVREE